MNNNVIYDSQGRVKFYITQSGKSKHIFDSKGKMIGSVTNGRTFDSVGKLVAYGEDISALTIGEK